MRHGDFRTKSVRKTGFLEGFFPREHSPAHRGRTTRRESTIAEEFGRRNYASYMLVDFSKAPDDMLGYFVDLRSDRNDPSNRMEIDFLIVELYENAAMKCRVSPIEVKSSKNYRTVSLDQFKAKFDKKVGTRYVLHPKPLVVENDVVKLPIYMAGLL